MPKGKIHLKYIIQNSQDYGGNDEHMVSRVFFDLEVNSTKHDGLYADVKQTVGGGSFESAPLEVSKPANYKLPYDYEAFREIIEQYYRDSVGAQGSDIRIGGGSSFRMRNNRVGTPRTEEFEIVDSGRTW